MDDKKNAENAEKFICENCDFKCCKKSDFLRHLSTDKHKGVTLDDKKNAENAENNSHLTCCDCGKNYKFRQGLWKHKQKCPKKSQTFGPAEITPELILSVLNQNKEYQTMLMDQNKFIVEMSKNSTNITNNISTNNSNNKTFNLQVYLNETCKDAMNIMDFVDSIKFQLSDLESVGELGYINGLSKIIIRNLKALDENMRPVHCSDLRREKIYVKDADKWEKGGHDNKILKNAIKYIAHKNVKMIPAFREKYPDCIYSDSRKSDQYNRLIIEAMGGDGNDENEKSNKIIKKIAREVLIDK
jgi:hypothetical protein